MRAWIFQSTVDRYDLRDEHNLAAGQKATWLATRYRDRMEPGDLVFLWLAGPPDIKGIYGWGHLTSKAYHDEDDDAYGVDVVYDHRLHQHLPIGRIEATDELSNLLILRAPQGTNFFLTDEEARALVKLLPSSERPEI